MGASLGTRLALGVTAASAAWSAAQIVSQIAGQPGAGEALLATGLTVGSALTAYVLSDLGSGFVHHALDNYCKPGPSVVGNMASLARAHHYFAKNSEQTTLAGELDPMAKIVAPLAAGLAVWNPHYLLQAGFSAALGGLLFAQTSHRMTHQAEAGKLVTIARKLKIAQPKEDHHAHHRAPWVSNYCLLNGICNPLLDRTHFWRKYEKAVFCVTGAEPKSWKHPAVREFALGSIDQTAYEVRMKTDMPEFRSALNMDAEREVARKFLHERFERPGISDSN